MATTDDCPGGNRFCHGDGVSWFCSLCPKRRARTIDSDDWAVVRMAELRAAGENAKFRMEWRVVKGRRLYECTIRREGGRIERQPRTEETVTGNASLQEQILRNAALQYARAVRNPEQGRRITLAREVLHLSDAVEGWADAARELARLTLLQAGWDPEGRVPPCQRVGCPRDGDCPVHGKDRPGQCVPEGEPPSFDSLRDAAARGREIVAELEAATGERMARQTLSIPETTHVCRTCDKAFHRPFRCCGADADLVTGADFARWGRST